MMLQSLKLRADKLTGITATDAAAATTVQPTPLTPTTAAGINPAAVTLPTPVAVVNANANGNVYNLTGNNNNNNNNIHHTNNNNNNNNHLTADNNNLNNIHQLHQYQAKYLETPSLAVGAAAAPTTPTTTSAAKSFHPYLRPPTTAAGAPTLFQTLLHNQINSATTTTIVGGGVADDATTASGLLTLPTAAAVGVAAGIGAGAGAGVTSPLNSSINSRTSLANPLSPLAVHFKREIMTDSEQSHMITEQDDAADYMALVPAGLVRSVSLDDCNDLLNSTINNNGNLPPSSGDDLVDQPDPDNIKMFVGQIPKAWDELQLRTMFEQYGRVHTLNVLRDKVTSVSRGCCFVTYYTRKAALKAQDALHNIKTLEGMHHPIQMKPADSENRNERKLFVGMLNKKYNEADVRQLFAGHGTIEECTVLRDQNGQSKGCAFVTFATKQNAIGAIKNLHQSQTMDGCSAPLVVKFADTQKEKDQKKIQQLQASICGISALTSPTQGAIAGIAPTPTNGLSSSSALVASTGRSNPSMAAALAAVSVPPPVSGASALVPTSAALSVTPAGLLTSSPQQTSPYMTTDMMNASAAQMQIFQQLQAFGLHPAQYLQGLNFPPDHSATTASLSAASNGLGSAAGTGLLAAPISMQNLVTLAALNSHQHHHHHTTHQQHHQQQQQQHHAHHLQTQAHHAAHTQQQAVTAQAHHAHMAQLMAAQQSAVVAAQPMTMSAATAATLWPGADSLTSHYAQALSPLTNGAYATAPLTASALQAAAAGVAGRQIEGPEGSNLFIYHLPQEFTDTDLATTFLPFGNVLSAKVFIDKQTNLSKCFGFVSYDNPHSANAAIQAMHGFQIGTKRLKVQLKRSKDAAKPY